MSSQAFNDTETAIDQFCAAYRGVCDYQMREEIKKTVERMKKLRRSSKAKL